MSNHQRRVNSNIGVVILASTPQLSGFIWHTPFSCSVAGVDLWNFLPANFVMACRDSMVALKWASDLRLNIITLVKASIKVWKVLLHLKWFIRLVERRFQITTVIKILSLSTPGKHFEKPQKMKFEPEIEIEDFKSRFWLNKRELRWYCQNSSFFLHNISLNFDYSTRCQGPLKSLLNQILLWGKIDIIFSKCKP